MTDASESAELEAQIGDGHKPPCPSCGSDLKIGRKRSGLSGSLAYTYSCTNKKCDLKPGLARVPWHKVALKALQHRAVHLVIVAAGSVTLTGIVGVATGLINFGSSSDSAAEIVNDGPYHVDQTTLVVDLTNRQSKATEDEPSKTTIDRFDVIVGHGGHENDYRIVYG